MFDQRFHAAERFGKRKYLSRTQDSLHIGKNSVAKPKAYDPAKTLELPFRKRMGRMTFEAGIIDLAHGRMRGKEFRDALGIRFMLLHTNGERLYSTEHEPGIERAGRGAE